MFRALVSVESVLTSLELAADGTGTGFGQSCNKMTTKYPVLFMALNWAGGSPYLGLWLLG